MSTLPSYTPMDGDIILRACDGVDFRVSKRIMAESSLVFQDMFTLGHLSPPNGDNTSESEANVVHVSEEGPLLAKFLDLFDSDANALYLDDIDDISKLYTVSDKYISRRETDITKAALMHHLPLSPLDVYLATCRLGLREEAKQAAKHTLRYPLPDLTNLSNVRNLDAFSIRSLERLHAYHQKCRSAALEVATCEYWARIDFFLSSSSAFPAASMCFIFDSPIPLPPSVFSRRPGCCLVSQPGVHEIKEGYYANKYFLRFVERVREVWSVRMELDLVGLVKDVVGEGIGCEKCGKCGLRSAGVLRWYAEAMTKKAERLIEEMQLDFDE